MDVDDLAFFLAILDAGSMAAVAKRRGVAISTISRRLDALEGALGVQLVDRRRDGARATAEGRQLAAAARRVVGEADGLRRLATALSGERLDQVVVSATESVAADVLAPAVGDLAIRAPGLKLDLRSEASVVSLAGRQADLAVRMSRPVGDGIVARKLAPIELGLYASHDYLAGRDHASLDLGRERLLVYDNSYGPIAETAWLDGRLTAAIACRANSTRGLVNMARAGAGIALLPSVLAEREGLRPVPSSMRFPPRQPWLLVHSDLRERPELRLVQGWISDTFKAVFARHTVAISGQQADRAL